MADGSVAPVDVRLAAFTTAGAINWAARWFKSGAMSAETVAARMIDLLTAGLAPRAT